jgi:hypothetical protein
MTSIHCIQKNQTIPSVVSKKDALSCRRLHLNSKYDITSILSNFIYSGAPSLAFAKLPGGSVFCPAIFIIGRPRLALFQVPRLTDPSCRPFVQRICRRFRECRYTYRSQFRLANFIHHRPTLTPDSSECT